MGKFYSEDDITWATIEKIVPYSKVVWHMGKNGIPMYKLFDENNKKLDIEFEMIK